MNQDKGPLSWLKKQFSKSEQGGNKKGKFPYLILVFAFGTGIMLFSNLFMKDTAEESSISAFSKSNSNQTEEVETFGQKKTAENNIIKEYEQMYEAQLKEALDTIVGVSDVTVVVNVDATEKQIYEKNKTNQTQVTDETDREGGKRKVEDNSSDEQLVIIQNGEKEVPIVVETKKPEIRGVLVVAKGADNIQVKKWIIEAVTRSLNVPSHQVAVIPKKSKGD